MSVSLFIARRLFWKSQRGSGRGGPLLGAALGLALSLIPLVIVDHVADGMIEGIIARYRETSSYHFQIRSWIGVERQQWENLVEKLASIPGIQSAWIERQGFGLARGLGAREGILLRALPPDALQRDAEFKRYIEFDSGSWILGKDDILLGRELARRLDVQIGDSLLVLTARQMPNGRYLPRISPLIVQGIFSSGYQDLDRSWAFISLELGWSVLSVESSQTLVGGKFSNLSDAPLILPRLSQDFSGQWNTSGWREINSYLLSNLESTRTILLFVMALIIIVAVCNVMTSLIMLTLERRREIGVLKCIGVSSASISRTFIAAGILSAAVGTGIGLGCGLLAAYFINPIIAGMENGLDFITGMFGTSPGPGLINEAYYLQYIPIQIRWRSTALIGIITLLLSLLLSWIPASQVARLRPLKVLYKH